MKIFEGFINGKCLYTPRGAAREYAEVACNFYRGCPYQCKYCYNRKGITAGTLGGDNPVLMDKFTDLKYRPKRLSHLSPEQYAFHLFREEIVKYARIVKEAGIFFSFTTDPMCLECFALTWMAAEYAIGLGIPVKILTKNAHYNMVQMVLINNIPRTQRCMLSLGFTLTGRDDWEPHADSNLMRIQRMQLFHEMGFRTFASVEPVVDFNSSYSMIQQTVGFCDEFLIGLMSKRPKELTPYDKEECTCFISDVDRLLTDAASNGRLHGRVRVYWKESMRKFMAHDENAMKIIRFEKWYGERTTKGV